jgi:hypothetical protein
VLAWRRFPQPEVESHQAGSGRVWQTATLSTAASVIFLAKTLPVFFWSTLAIISTITQWIINTL